MTKRKIPHLEGQSVQLFREAVKSEETWLQYERRFWHFLDWLRENPDSFHAHSEKDHKWAEQKIIDYISMQKERVRRGEISNITVSNFKKPLKLFLEMNDVTLNWKKINKTLPSMRRYALDRAPTVEEIRRLIQYPDQRVEVMVLFMCSSGIRVGAWNWLRVGNLYPIMKNGNLVACKVIVYEGDPEQYVTFITPEAYDAVQRYLEYRQAQGEHITAHAPLIRNYFHTGRGQRRNRASIKRERIHLHRRWPKSIPAN